MLAVTCPLKLSMITKPAIVSVPALALGGVGSLPRASRFRGPHSSKKRTLKGHADNDLKREKIPHVTHGTDLSKSSQVLHLGLI